MKSDYQGWSNRETWAAHLWVSNNRLVYEYFLDKAKNIPSWDLSLALRQYFIDMVDEVKSLVKDRTESNMVLDLVPLWSINWEEIAGAFYEGGRTDESPYFSL